jgi:glucan phosphoethanolaminetransferase (alkaline phosphatase superfamily)
MNPDSRPVKLPFVLLLALVLGLHVAAFGLGLLDHRLSMERVAVMVGVLMAGCTVALVLPACSARWAWALLLASAYMVVLPLWLSLLLALLHGWSGRRWWWQAALLAVGMFAALIVAFLRKHGFTGSTLLAVLQTHPAEAGDFVLSNLSQRVVLGWTAAMAVCLTAAWTQLAALPALLRRAPVAVLAFAVLAPLMQETVPAVRGLLALQREQGREIVEPAGVGAAEAGIDVVLVLGESTTRWHFSLYGYPYPTTPNLQRHARELVWLEDAISSYSHTAQSVGALMLRPARNGQPAQVESLVSRLKAMEVWTSWSSTQAAHGPFDSAIRNIALGAHETRFFTSRSMTLPKGFGKQLGLGEGFTADEDMVDSVRRKLAEPPADGRSRFLVAHTTAAHGEYCRLIPHAARKGWEELERGTRYFGDARDRSSDVNCYDAAISHIDRLVASLVEQARESSRPVVVIFAPDHGEDPEGGSGHSANAHSARHIEIPVVFAFNEAAVARRGQAWSLLKAHRGKPFFLPWLHESILDLFSPEGDGVMEQRETSIFSADYAPAERLVFAGEGAMNYDSVSPGDRKDYLGQTRVNMATVRSLEQRPRHLLAHRSNSEAALLEAMQSFDGVEMDVVFNRATGRFDVHHPPKPSGGLTLERALQVVSSRPGLKLWLDWKNPEPDLAAAAFVELERLQTRFDIVNRTVLEVTPPSGGALELPQAARRWRLAFGLGLNVEDLARCSQAPSSADCSRLVQTQAAAIRASAAPCVAYDLTTMTLARRIAEAAASECEVAWDTQIVSTSPRLEDSLRGLQHLDMLVVRFPSRYLY